MSKMEAKLRKSRPSQGGYGNASEHFSNCPKLPIKCNNVECQHVVVREGMPIHAVSCMKRTVQCHDCKKHVKWEMLHEHQAGQCDNAVIPCPLHCGSVFSRYVRKFYRLRLVMTIFIPDCTQNHVIDYRNCKLRFAQIIG